MVHIKMNQKNQVPGSIGDIKAIPVTMNASCITAQNNSRISHSNHFKTIYIM